MGRGHVSLSADLDAWQPKPFGCLGHLLLYSQRSVGGLCEYSWWYTYQVVSAADAAPDVVKIRRGSRGFGMSLTKDAAVRHLIGESIRGCRVLVDL